MRWQRPERSLRRRVAPVRKLSALATGLLAVSVAACAAGGSGGDPAATSADQDDESYTIRYTSVGATGSEIMDQVEWFAREVEERSAGRVEFEIFLDGTLVGAAETLPAVLDGRAQAGYLCDCYAPDEFPVWSLFSTPFHGNNAEAIMLTARDLSRADGLLADEFAGVGVHPLWFHTIGAGLTYMREPVAAPSDLRGLRLRAIGQTAAAFEHVGAEAVAMDPGEIYESVQRGAIDGVGTFFFPTARAFGIHEVAPHVADPGTGFYASVGFLVDAAFWEDLPEELRQILTEVADELMDGVAIDIYETASTQACDAFLDAGGSITVFDDADVTAWRDEVLPPMRDRWIESVVTTHGAERGDVEAFYDEYVRIMRGHADASDHVPDAEACASRG